MLESYAISIDTLPEYRRYIEPIIRKIGRGRGDILTTYMLWGVKHKDWYMIPRPLTDLSHEQIGTGFSTEQYALNNDNRVYIAKATYLKMDHKERANLLMHEIVMSARLLMKKTPKEQCEKLAGTQVAACSDAEMMKLAEATDMSEADRSTMDAQDHDAVKSMTIFLMQHTEDVSASTITAKRRELGFIFPWDKAMSNLAIPDLRIAFERSKLSGETFSANANIRQFAKPTAVRCEVEGQSWNDDVIRMNVRAVIDQPIDYSWDPAKAPPDWQPVTRDYFTYQLPNGTYTSAYIALLNSASFEAVTDDFEAHGVLDPADAHRVVDLVRLRPHLSSAEVYANQWQRVGQYKQIEVLISRDETPQILKITVSGIAVHMLHPVMKADDITPDAWEFVVSKKEAFSCTPSSGLR